MPFPMPDDFIADESTATRSFRSNQDLVIVEVGDKSIDAKIEREGIHVGTFEIDPDVLEEIIVGPAIRQVVLKQSIKPGTPVAIGTAVDLMLAPTKGFPGRTIPGLLKAVSDISLGVLHQQLVDGNSRAKQILTRVGPKNTLPVREQALLIELFTENGYELTGEPGADADAALETLRAANAFGV